MTYKNKETNELYTFLAVVHMSGNIELVVIYHPCDNGHSIYVMNEDQFYSEFDVVV